MACIQPGVTGGVYMCKVCTILPDTVHMYVYTVPVIYFTMISQIVQYICEVLIGVRDHMGSY